MDTLEELKCSLCLEPFARPVTLPCGHTFCEDCLTAAYARQPKCPNCRQPILGNGRFQINFAMQQLVERLVRPEDRQQEARGEAPVPPAERPVHPHPLPDVDADWVVDPTEHRLSVFEVVAAPKSFYFPYSLYQLTVHFPHPPSLFPELVPFHFFVARFRHRNATKATYLAKVEEIIKFTQTGIKMLVRFQGRFRPASIHAEEVAFQPHHPQEQGAEPVPPVTLTVQLARGHVVYPAQPAVIPVAVERNLDRIEVLTSRLLHRVAQNNPQIAHIAAQKSGVEARGDRLSVSWRINAFEFLERVGSILALPYPQKKVVARKGALANKVTALLEVLGRLDDHVDPLFLLDTALDQQPSLPWAQIGFVAALLAFLAALLFPQVRAVLG